MTRSTVSRNRNSDPEKDSCRRLNLILMAAIVAAGLACAPQAALCQHGGGGHGGGGHFGGGGGSHIGGGTHASGASGSHRPATGMQSRGAPSGAPAPSVSLGHDSPFATSRDPLSSSFARPAGSAAGLSALGDPAQATSVPEHVTIGFPPANGTEEFVRPGSGSTGYAFAPIHGGVLSFSGQGHEIWQDNAAPSTRLRPDGSRSSLESRPPATMLPRPYPPRRFRGGYWGPGYGYGYGGFYPYWGFGLGFGFGGWCDPTWNFNCGYGYYGPYAPGYYSSGDDSEGLLDNSQDNGVYLDQDTAPDNSLNPNANPATVLYLNNGTSFTVTDYWVADYKLHYVTDGARENVIDLDQIDVQRTVDANAARGVNFSLRPAPGAAPNPAPLPH